MIKVLKLTTGEELIADVTEEDQIVKLKQPIRLMLSPTGEVGMMPFAPFLATEIVEIQQSVVLYQGEPESELKNAYNSKFGSGIVTAGAADLQIVT